MAVVGNGGTPQVAAFGEVAECRHIVGSPRFHDVAVDHFGEPQHIRVGVRIRAEYIKRVRRGRFFREERAVAEIPRGVLRPESPDGAVVEIVVLGGIRERRLDNHQRARVLLRPLLRPIRLLAQGRAERLVVHRGENFARVAAGVLENFAGGVDCPHCLVGNARAGAGCLQVRRIVVVVRELCGILIPRIRASVEIRVPHNNRRARAVAFEKARDLAGIHFRIFVVVRRHREEVVKPRAVALVQIGVPRDLREAFEGVEAHGVVVQLLDVRDVLRHRRGIYKILAQAVERGGSPHSKARLFAVQHKSAVFDPHFAEAEVASGKSVENRRIRRQHDGHFVEIRIFDVPEQRIFPLFGKFDDLLGLARKLEFFGKFLFGVFGDKRKAELNPTLLSVGIGDFDVPENFRLPVRRKCGDGGYRELRRGFFKPNVADCNFLMVANRWEALPQPRVRAVDENREDVAVGFCDVGDVEPLGVGYRRKGFKILTEGMQELAVEVYTPVVAV